MTISSLLPLSEAASDPFLADIFRSLQASARDLDRIEREFDRLDADVRRVRLAIQIALMPPPA